VRSRCSVAILGALRGALARYMMRSRCLTRRRAPQVLVSEVQQRLSSAHAAAEAARDAAHCESVRAESLAAEKRLLVASEQRGAAQVTRCTPRACITRAWRASGSPEQKLHMVQGAQTGIRCRLQEEGVGSGCRPPYVPASSGGVL